MSDYCNGVLEHTEKQCYWERDTQFTTSSRLKLVPSLRSLSGPFLWQTCLIFGGKNACLELLLHFFLSNPFFKHDILRNYEKKKIRFIGTLKGFEVFPM